MASEYQYKPNGEVPAGEQLPPGLRRYALGVEYCGARLHGFQKQKSAARTVQALLEQGLSSIAAEPVTLVCAGRTDAGVHATNQVIHFDTSAQRPQRAWVQGVNTKLPDEVRVRWAQEMPAQFHARFSARARSYRYLIHSSPTRSAQAASEVTWTQHPLDLDAMRSGAQHLLGRHDFSSYRASQCQAKSPVREITGLDIARVGQLIVLEISANAFLHHMVRNIVGTLLPIGSGEQPMSFVADALAALDRDAAGITAPADGLYLVSVRYPEQYPMLSGARLPVFF